MHRRTAGSAAFKVSREVASKRWPEVQQRKPAGRWERRACGYHRMHGGSRARLFSASEAHKGLNRIGGGPKLWVSAWGLALTVTTEAQLAVVLVEQFAQSRSLIGALRSPDQATSASNTTVPAALVTVTAASQ